MPTGEQAVFKVIRAVPQSLPKKALHISLRGCETFEDILREVRITRYDYEVFFFSFMAYASSFFFNFQECFFLSLLTLYHSLITSELPQVYDTSAIIISLPGSN